MLPAIAGVVFEIAGVKGVHMSNTPTQFGQSLQNLMNESLGVVASENMSICVQTELKRPQRIKQRTIKGKKLSVANFSQK
jgi:hypothetical protein